VTLTIEFDEGDAIEWHLTDDGAEAVRREGYTPTLYVAGPDDALATVRERLDRDPKVAFTARERWFTSLSADEREAVLRVDTERVGEVRTVARELRARIERESLAPGTLRLYNVDLDPGFRYCLETGTDPVPERSLRTLSVRIDERALAERDLTHLRIDGDDVRGDPEAVVTALERRLTEHDPDVLVVSSADLLPLVDEHAAALGLGGFEWGRAAGLDKLAGESTYHSYGEVGHSPARYAVPGRAVVDTSNSFLWGESSIAGLLDLVERAGSPLQAVARASIGTVLTAIQIRAAVERDVLIPWNKWDPEAFKDARTLRAADRGGFTFSPDVGLHEDVYEVDFASLYPRIICQYNVSPETVDCACHAGRADVPELDYAVCDERGFLPRVLQPIVDDRAAIKERLRTEDLDETTRQDLEATSSALKWILVSCFGYQGYRNAKFGRIECHEAINAYAREILLTAKEHLERAGWRVVHGIVDSLWVTPRADVAEPPTREDLRAVCADVSDAVDVPLEYEGAFEWVAFVPKRDSREGALTKYVGKLRDEDGYKVRGIECRQDSTPPFVADAQRDFLDALDEERDPAAVCDVLRRKLTELRAGDVPAAELAIERRVSKRVADYARRTRAVAAAERAKATGMERAPGQSVRYVVVDDDARQPERVRLPFEAIERYDADHYATLLVRACESVVSPLGWDEARIRRYLNAERDATLSAYR